jgi:hypothetical protein
VKKRDRKKVAQRDLGLTGRNWDELENSGSAAGELLATIGTLTLMLAQGGV